MGTNNVRLYSGDSDAYIETYEKITQKISEQPTAEGKVDVLYDHGKKVVQKLQDSKEGFVKTTARRDGFLSIQVEEKLLEPKGIKQLLPKKVDDLRTKQRIAGHVPKKVKKGSINSVSKLEAAIVDLECATTNDLEHAMLIETIAKKALESHIRRGVDFTAQAGVKDRLKDLVDRAEAQRIQIQSAQPNFVSIDPVTNKKIELTAHRMNPDGKLSDGFVVPNGEIFTDGVLEELKSFYTAKVEGGQIIGRHAVCDTEEKADSLAAFLKTLPPRRDKKAKRVVFCQLNSQEVKKEKRMIENQHLEMTKLASKKVEVAHLNLPTNGFFDFNRSLKRILPSGLVDFFLSGEKESALQNGSAFVTYLTWLENDGGVKMTDPNLMQTLQDDANRIRQCNKNIRKLSKELKGSTGNEHKIKSKQIEQEVRLRARLRENLHSNLKAALVSNQIDAKSSGGMHFIKLLKSQLAIEYVSRGEELMLKNLVNYRLGVHSFSNCKSGFDRTGIAFAVDLAQAQFRDQVLHTLKEKSKCDTAREEILDLTKGELPTFVKRESDAVRLTKVLTFYSHYTNIPDHVKKELIARQRSSGLQPGNPDFFSVITKVMDKNIDPYHKLLEIEGILAKSSFTDSEKRMILKQILFLEAGNDKGIIPAGLDWIGRRAEDQMAANWDTISRQNILAGQNNMPPVSQDVENFRTLVMKNLLELGLPIIHRGIGVLGLKWGKGRGAQLIPLRFIPSHILIHKGKGIVEKVEIVDYDKSGNVKGLSDTGHRLMTRLSPLRGA